MFNSDTNVQECDATMLIVVMQLTSSSYPSPEGEGRRYTAIPNIKFFHFNLNTIPNKACYPEPKFPL